MEINTRVLKNQYHDSVALMLAAKQLKAHTEVEDAALIMGTEINKELLVQGGLLTNEAQSARPNDLIISIKCKENAGRFLDEAEELISAHAQDSGSESGFPESIRSAKRVHPDLNLAVISLAGSYAAREAREALTSGLHVLLFSDNVSLKDEIALKKFASERHLLLMGPGAGTALINGAGLGFANSVPRGRIGIVSAAGTGLQEVSTLIARKGGGISQGIGNGGRDLSREVGGLMFFSAIDALKSDPGTDIIVLISKPPAESVTRELLDRIGNLDKKFVLCLLGASPQQHLAENLYFTHTLEGCAYTAVALLKGEEPDIQGYINKEDEKLNPFIENWKGKSKEGQHNIRGLYSGGTLCYEAQVILNNLLDEPVFSNTPLDKQNQLNDSNQCVGHALVDLGEEEFTRGRPHPMIDNDLRIRRLEQEALDPEVAVILLDLVLGYGAHPDPAKELAAAIHQVTGRLEKKQKPVAFVASVTGTEGDPQGFTRSRDLLQKAGVMVCESNAQATRLAAKLSKGR